MGDSSDCSASKAGDGQYEYVDTAAAEMVAEKLLFSQVNFNKYNIKHTGYGANILHVAFIIQVVNHVFNFFLAQHHENFDQLAWLHSPLQTEYFPPQIMN